MLYSCVREYSVRRYLDGFSDAIVPNSLPAEQKITAILDWMRDEPSRANTTNPEALAKRDPEMTLTYRQLLNVCGTATNAFLNLARSSDLRVRRLLLLTPDRRTKHVVAEVLIDERWIIVDPTFRVIMKDARGRYLTRSELRNPAVFSEAAGAIPNYPHEYSYDQFAHVRLARLPLENPALPSAAERRPCGRRILLRPGDQGVACAASAASPSLRATPMPNRACGR